jgi:hypothetical protein
MVTAISELQENVETGVNNQTNEFVETLTISQNLSRHLSNLTDARIDVELNQTDRLNELIRVFNLTLAPNATILSQQQQQ